MRLFYHRPLAAACALFILCLFALYFLPITIAVAFVIVGAALSIAVLVWCIFRGFSCRRILLFLALLALLLAGSREYRRPSA